MSIKFSSKRPLTKKEEAEIQKMIEADPDNPELTDEQIAEAKPFKEAFPRLAEQMEKAVRGRPRLEKPKTPVTIRLDQDVVDRFKATGRGWQGRMNDALRKAVGL
ncbi:hypothetical protein ATN84_22795 [Paramesorhizobium deserti]|uniref:BrnA antitoxin family protein n=1 Tax=Paramesorhizobium deserti TaxID=1494590 RepID=A0A135HNL0_9HYPH|nr:BrnA antitoxin family protein [Paramesorhizobium deserti]KXF74726.1 hypothetical protein ATN84_22795 [Paramesorhizobium deserti]